MLFGGAVCLPNSRRINFQPSLPTHLPTHIPTPSLPSPTDGYLAIVGFVIGILIVVFSYVYIRKRVLYLLKTHPEEVDAHQMIINGEIEAPGVCCCSPNTCPRGCYF